MIPDRLTSEAAGPGRSGSASGISRRNFLQAGAAAGIDPESIDVVALSHAHPDHVWGLVGEDGKPHFPNAQIHITQADLEYWTDEAKLSDPALGHYIGPIREALLPVRDRIAFVKDGQEVVPGMQALSTPGHTVGHTSFVISSQGGSIVYIGDLAHQPLLQMENPRAEFARDTDAKQGVASRLGVFDMVASGKIPIVAYHFPWPGIGHVAKNGDHYRYVATEMQTVLQVAGMARIKVLGGTIAIQDRMAFAGEYFARSLVDEMRKAFRSRRV